MKGLYKGTFRKLLAAMTALGLTLTGVVSASAAGGSQKAKSETEILSEQMSDVVQVPANFVLTENTILIHTNEII